MPVCMAFIHCYLIAAAVSVGFCLNGTYVSIACRTVASAGVKGHNLLVDTVKNR